MSAINLVQISKENKTTNQKTKKTKKIEWNYLKKSTTDRYYIIYENSILNIRDT